MQTGPQSPIIFTDVNDLIDYNDGIVSPNRVPTDTGKWGGIIILGDAMVGQDGGNDDIEGIASGYDWTNYGGSNDNDSSGVLTMFLFVTVVHNWLVETKFKDYSWWCWSWNNSKQY